MSRDRIQERLGHRYLRHFIITILGLIVAITGFAVWKMTATMQEERTTIIITSDPMYIVSWDDKRHYLTLFMLPGEMYIDATRGVGSYPVASIRKLEVMDKTKKGLLRESMEDALGLPIRGVVDGGRGDTSPVKLVKDALSPFYFSAWSRGDGITLSLRFRLWYILTFVRPDEVTIVDLSAANGGIYRSETLPDGSVVRVFDDRRFDALFGQTLEEHTIRQEGLRVRVVNATDIVGLGNRAARIISHAGMVVIMVESETPALMACTVTASKSLWDSKSVSFMKTFFNCNVDSGSDDEQAEITIRLGQKYANRFLPE